MTDHGTPEFPTPEVSPLKSPMVVSHGIITWRSAPTNSVVMEECELEVCDYRRHLEECGSVPQLMTDYQTLEGQWIKRGFKTNIPAKFPFYMPKLTPYLVALERRKASEATIDFSVGGSFLNALANYPKTPEDEYWVAKFNGCLFVEKATTYTININANGHMFERMLSNEELVLDHLPDSPEHVSEWDVNGHRILISAQVDLKIGADLVEVKSYSSSAFKTKEVFQVLSSGSKFVLSAKRQGGRIITLNLETRDEVYKALVKQQKVPEFEQVLDTVSDALEELKQLTLDLETGKTFSLIVNEGRFELEPSDTQILGRPEVMEQLLRASSNKL